MGVGRKSGALTDLRRRKPDELNGCVEYCVRICVESFCPRLVATY